MCYVLNADIRLQAADAQIVLASHTQNAVRLYINAPIVPDELNFIVEEMAIKRFRMVGSEHLNSETIGNVSFSYSEGLAEYRTFLDQHKTKSGKLRAL